MKIGKIQIAIIFKLDNEIILSLGSQIKSIQKDFNAKMQMMNAPLGAPPDAPRIIMLSENFAINIGLNRFDIVVNVPNHIIESKDEALNFVKNIFNSLAPYLLKGNIEYQWLGIIANIDFPNKKKQSGTQIMTPIFDNLVKIDRENLPLASFNLMYGFQEKDYFKNYNISTYDFVKIPIKPNQNNVKVINMKITPGDIEESGVSLVLDINNKPLQKKLGIEKDFENVFSEVKSSLMTIVNKTNLSEVINE